MSKPRWFMLVVIGAMILCALAFSACASDPRPTPVPTPTATPTPEPTPTPTPTPEPTPEPTPDPTPDPVLEEAQAPPQEIIDALHETLGGATLADLTSLAGQGDAETIGVLCDIANGKHEPDMVLEDFNQDAAVLAGIRGFCAGQ